LGGLTNLTRLEFGSYFNQRIDVFTGFTNNIALKLGYKFNKTLEPFIGLNNFTIFQDMQYLNITYCIIKCGRKLENKVRK